MPAIDLLGQTFGRLTVIADGGSDKDANKLWHCRCDCGGNTLSRGSSLRFGTSQSCGAIVSDPVATDLNSFFNNTIVGGMGLQCADDTGGVRIDPTTNSPACPTFAIVCTSSACTPNTYGDRNLANFNDIYTADAGRIRLFSSTI